MDNLDFLYQTLKVYLVLGRQGPLDRELVLQWVQADLLADVSGRGETATRDSLLDACRRAAAPAAAADRRSTTPLIAQARAVLNKEPLAEYSYNRLLRSKRVTAIPAWTVAENGGPGAGRVFQYHIGQRARYGLARHLHLGWLPQRVPAAAADGHAGHHRGCLGAGPGEAGRAGDDPRHDPAAARRAGAVSRRLCAALGRDARRHRDQAVSATCRRRWTSSACCRRRPRRCAT